MSPSCRHIKCHMILSQPGAWSAKTYETTFRSLEPPQYDAEHHAACASYALRVVGRSEYFASSSGEHFWRSLSVVLMDAAPVLATRKRSDRDPENPAEGPAAHRLSQASCKRLTPHASVGGGFSTQGNMRKGGHTNQGVFYCFVKYCQNKVK